MNFEDLRAMRFTAWCLIIFWMVIFASCFGCARIIVQVGTNHEVDSTIEVKPKTGVAVDTAAKPKEQ
jgi:hypothetical protein